MRVDRQEIPNHQLLPEVRKLLSEGKSVILRVKGSSMLPFIRGGKDSVRLAPANTLIVGDIILAEVFPGKFCLHRLIEIHSDFLVMMGDGNLYGREKFRRENVIGKVIAIIREGGREIDCCSARERKKAIWWYRLLPVRRWLLAIWRRLF